MTTIGGLWDLMSDSTDDGSSRYVSLDDLRVGSKLPLYGRVYLLYDADRFTRQFFSEQLGITLDEAHKVPIDPFHRAILEEKRHKETPMLEAPMSSFADISRGKPSRDSLQRTRQLLNNFRKVLRFWGCDPASIGCGEPSEFVLHYFLADNTIEVHRVLNAKTGLDVSAAFIKRQKIPRFVSPC